MDEKKIRRTLIVLINEFLEMSANRELLLKDISMRFFSGLGKENYGKSWVALRKMQVMLTSDYYQDTQGSQPSRTRSYLVTRSADGSLALTDVEFEFPEKPMESGDILQCRAISKTAKLS